MSDSATKYKVTDFRDSFTYTTWSDVRTLTRVYCAILKDGGTVPISQDLHHKIMDKDRLWIKVDVI